jgi:hypothetical protein
MTTGEDDARYQLLTAMLHWKIETATIKVEQLDDIYNSLCGTTGNSDKPDKKICDLIAEEANGCLSAGTGLNLENKIVLAIGIRLKAEQFMIDKIADPRFVASISANQTQVLIDRFKKDFLIHTDALGVLDRVALMTPENIHVNSFMYEPILDMSDDHLRKLYKDVTKLG